MAVSGGSTVPYIVHLEGVARILIRYDHRDPILQAAALLHDKLEDTDVSVRPLLGSCKREQQRTSEVA